MYPRPTGPRLAAGVTITLVAVLGVLVAPTAAFAAHRQRGESGHDTTAVKTATATCPDGEVVIGAGGRIRDGGGRVALSAVVPTQTSVTVRGQALAGHQEPWSVVASAVCQSESIGSSGVVTGQPGTPSTAGCAAGARLRGAGFQLPPGVLLTGLIPDLTDATVTVRTTAAPASARDAIAYAICVRRLPVSHRLRQYRASSAVDGSAVKSVTADRGESYEFPQMSGVGGEVIWADDSAGPVHIGRPDVFIDTLQPTDDLSGVHVQAVRRATGAALGRVGFAPTAGPDEEQHWSTDAHAIGDVYYY